MAATTPTRSTIRVPSRGAAPLSSVFLLLWIAFVAALIFSQGTLDSVWHWLGTLPLIGQVVIWVLFLPVVVGLWSWESDWSLWVRLAVVIFIAITSLAVMGPKPQPGQIVQSTPSDRGSQSARGDGGRQR
jgi:hypothetical protein